MNRLTVFAVVAASLLSCLALFAQDRLEIKAQGGDLSVKINGKEVDASRFKTANGGFEIVIPNADEPKESKAGKDVVPTPEPLTDDLKNRLRRVGYTSEDLKSLTYYGLEGYFRGDISIEDPACILVCGSRFTTRGNLRSKGPILFTEKSVFLGDELVSDRFILIDDGSSIYSKSLQIKTPQLFLASTVGNSNYLVEIYGKPTTVIPNRDWEMAVLRERPIAEVARILTGNEDIGKQSREWIVSSALEKEMPQEVLSALVTQYPDLKTMKVVAVGGRYHGSRSDPIVQTDPNTVLVVRADFSSHQAVYSAGPIVLFVRRAFLANRYYTQKWIAASGGRDGSIDVDVFPLQPFGNKKWFPLPFDKGTTEVSPQTVGARPPRRARLGEANDFALQGDTTFPRPPSGALRRQPPPTSQLF